ncbi:hypothetical protein ACFLR5_01345 [Elusimicrobiota bacterium]
MGAIGKGEAIKEAKKQKTRRLNRREIAIVKEKITELKATIKKANLTRNERNEANQVLERLEQYFARGDIVSFNAVVKGSENYLLSYATDKIVLARDFLTQSQFQDYLDELLFHEGYVAAIGEEDYQAHQAIYKGIQRKIFGKGNPLRLIIREYIEEKRPVIVELPYEDRLEYEDIQGAKDEGRYLVVQGKDENSGEQKNTKIFRAIDYLKGFNLELPEGLRWEDVIETVEKANVPLIHSKRGPPEFVVYPEAKNNNIYISQEIFARLDVQKLAGLLAAAGTKMVAQRTADEQHIPWTEKFASKIYQITENEEVIITGISHLTGETGLDHEIRRIDKDLVQVSRGKREKEKLIIIAKAILPGPWMISSIRSRIKKHGVTFGVWIGICQLLGYGIVPPIVMSLFGPEFGIPAYTIPWQMGLIPLYFTRPFAPIRRFLETIVEKTGKVIKRKQQPVDEKTSVSPIIKEAVKSSIETVLGNNPVINITSKITQAVIDEIADTIPASITVSRDGKKIEVPLVIKKGSAEEYTSAKQIIQQTKLVDEYLGNSIFLPIINETGRKYDGRFLEYIMKNEEKYEEAAQALKDILQFNARTLAQMIYQVKTARIKSYEGQIREIADWTGIDHIQLGGGIMQNTMMREYFAEEIKSELKKQLPAGALKDIYVKGSKVSGIVGGTTFVDSSSRDAKTVIGVDIGGTSASIGWAEYDSKGNLINAAESINVKRNSNEPLSEYYNRIGEAVKQVSSELKIQGIKVAQQVGLSHPGKREDDGTIAIGTSPNLIELEGKNPGEALNLEDMQVFWGNDALAQALAGYYALENRIPSSSFIYLGLGTGLGTAFFETDAKGEVLRYRDSHIQHDPTIGENLAKRNMILIQTKAIEMDIVKNTPIKFGTSGYRWRRSDMSGIETDVSPDTILENIKRMAQATALYYHRDIKEGAILIGFDTRKDNPEYARLTASILAANNVPVRIIESDVTPTPVLGYLANSDTGVGGVIDFTASHNKGIDNGFKFSPYHGGAASNDVTAKLSELANAVEEYRIMDYKAAVETRIIERVSQETVETEIIERISQENAMSRYIDSYVIEIMKKLGAWESIVKYIRNNPEFKIVLDPLQGTAYEYMRLLYGYLAVAAGRSLEDLAIILHTNTKDPYFKDVNGAPNPTEPGSIKDALDTVASEKNAIGILCDGDADRFGIIDTNGKLISANELMALLVHFMHSKGEKGVVVKTLATSDFMTAVAKKYGIEVIQTPTGFKYAVGIANSGKQILVAGEESAHGGVGRFLKSWDDGIAMGLMGLWMLAEGMQNNNENLTAYKHRIEDEIGEVYTYERVSVDLTDTLKTDAQNTMENAHERGKAAFNMIPEAELANVEEVITEVDVLGIKHKDGVKVVFKDGSWFQIRLSGTEPVARLYTEGVGKDAESSRARQEELINIGQRVLGIVPEAGLVEVVSEYQEEYEVESRSPETMELIQLMGRSKSPEYLFGLAVSQDADAVMDLMRSNDRESMTKSLSYENIIGQNVNSITKIVGVSEVSESIASNIVAIIKAINDADGDAKAFYDGLEGMIDAKDMVALPVWFDMINSGKLYRGRFFGNTIRKFQFSHYAKARFEMYPPEIIRRVADRALQIDMEYVKILGEKQIVDPASTGVIQAKELEKKQKQVKPRRGVKALVDAVKFMIEGTIKIQTMPSILASGAASGRFDTIVAYAIGNENQLQSIIDLLSQQMGNLFGGADTSDTIVPDINIFENVMTAT